MLFLDTCTVKAGTYNSMNFVQSVGGTCTLVFGAEGTGQSAGSITNGTGSIVGTRAYYREGGTWHIKFGFSINGSWTNTYDGDRLYKVVTEMASFQASSGTVSNINFYTSDGVLLNKSGFDNYYKKDSDLCVFVDGVNQGYTQSFICEFDICFANNTLNDNISTSEPYVTNFSFIFRNYVTPASESEINSQKVETNDSQANESLDNVEQSSQSTADNTSGILSKITDFFGSFFENLIGIFVPEDGYFSGWFNRVNTLLSDKLGMLYAPFDLVISTLQAIYSSSTTESGIPFPGIKWEDTWLVEPFTFTFASLGSDFDDLRDKVYFATDTVLVLTFLMLLQSKVKLILEGHE